MILNEKFWNENIWNRIEGTLEVILVCLIIYSLGAVSMWLAFKYHGII
jgi:hypothetical protein